MDNMVTTKPYLIRAIWQWCVDQGFTPYLSVRLDEHTRVPPGYAKDGEIILNIGFEATSGLDIGNDFISFQARFNGVAQALLIPVPRVQAIYARENGQGMGFELEETPTELVPESPAASEVVQEASAHPEHPPAGGRPHLTRIK